MRKVLATSGVTPEAGSSSSEQLEVLFRLGSSVLAAESEVQVLAAIVEQALGLANALAATIGIVERDEVRLVAESGYPEGHLDPWRRFPLAKGYPMTDVVVSRKPVYCASREERDRRWPLFRGVGESDAFVVLPLVGREGLMGALTLSYREAREFDLAARSFLEAFATQCALGLERVRAYASLRIAQERTARLQRFSTRLAPALTMAAVAEVAVDKALVASRATTAVLALENGGGIEIARIDGRLDERMVGSHSLSLDHASALGEVFRTHSPLWLRNREEWERFPESIGRPEYLRSAAVLPVQAAGEFFGVLAIAFGEDREFPDDEQKFLGAIATQTALALDRARLHEEQQHIAHVLQKGLLPRSLPDIPGVELATYYLAAGQANVTGGDFYDVFQTAEGYILAVGDVCGHGPEAAALTALCRYTLRACSLREEDVRPARLLELLNRSIIEHGPLETDFASATCALVVPRADRMSVTLASAGHPPTLVRRKDGSVETYASNGPLAGVQPDAAYPEELIELFEGDLLVLYTDGILDARTPSGLRLGFDAAERVLASLPEPAGPEDVLDAYKAVLAKAEPTDDIAILVAHVKGGPPGPTSIGHPSLDHS